VKILGYFVLVFFILTSSYKSYGQCFGFINERFSSDIIEVHLEMSYERNRDELINQAREDLKIKLRTEMSEKILSTVKSQTTSDVVETNNKFSSYFDSHVDIQSSSNLSYGNFSFCEDKEEKKVHGRFTINKLQLAKANFADCLSAIKGLSSEINAVYNSSNNVDAGVYKKGLDLLNAHKKTSIYLDSEIDVSAFDAYYKECQEGIAKLNQTQVQMHYEEEMGIVSDSLGMERFNYAIKTLRRLQKQFRGDELIQKELASAEESYKSKLKRDVLLYETNSRYESALKAIDDYCALLSCENEIKDIKMHIQMEYFDQVYVQLENALAKGLETEIQKFKLQIDNLKDVNIKKYIEIQNKCTDYERSKSIEQTETLFNQKEYQGAYDLIKTLEGKYGKADPEILHIKKKVGGHIVRQMIKDEKKKRPFTYSLQLGGEMFSNEIALDSLNYFQASTWSFAYTGGVYKYYNLDKYSDHNADRKVKYADFIGLKFTYLDYPSTFYTGVGDSTLAYVPSKYACQIGIDGLSARFLHYSIGVKYSNFNAIQTNWRNPAEYYGTVGLRVGVRRINWITDFGFRTQFEGKANFQISTGLYYRLDFNRKFGRRDRLECKSKLK
jgi:hypothetical protein